MNLRRFSLTFDCWMNNLADIGRGGKRVVSMCVDAFLCMFALWAAYSLRYGQPFSDFSSTWHIFLLLPALSVVIFTSLGIYKWVVRSTNRRLFKQLLKASIASGASLVLLLFLLPPDRITPRSLFSIYTMVLILSSCGLRFLWQGLFDAGNRGEPIAVYGAGAAGRQLVSLLSHGDEYRPMVFIDDNKKLKATTVAGLPVIRGEIPNLAEELERFEVRRVVMAIPSLTSGGYQRKLEKLEGIGMPIQTIPSVTELVAGTARADEIRDISIQDILGRQEVPANPELLGHCVTGKHVLITGGGGSIGSELCRQVIALAPTTLVIVDNSEANLYYITEELEQTIGRIPVDARPQFHPFLCSVTDGEFMDSLVAQHKFDTVYHAAAYKHVPIVERQPEQGLEVNVFGTLAVLKAAIKHHVSHFVLISTDKAVRPTNAMGATKRTAELILQAKAQQKPYTKICMVRFGNVLGSSGSVVPKFKKQILAGGPITVTHPDITRFFMTIPEASQLVLQASAIAEGGEVFVLDMGEPVRIEDMAVTMVKLYGKRLSRETGKAEDIDIVVKGLRPGEKMFEELFISMNHQPTKVAKVMKADEVSISWEELLKQLADLQALAEKKDITRLKSKLLSLAFLEQEVVSSALATGEGEFCTAPPELV